MPITFTPLGHETVQSLRKGATDSYGLPPEHRVADGGEPCRHCLRPIPAGAGYLVLAHRPFPVLQPYAETGPIFLCAADCPAGGGAALPEMLDSPDYIIRGYGADDRIVYGTGAVVPTASIPAEAEARFADSRVAYIHIRSARNNCYQCRIDRG